MTVTLLGKRLSAFQTSDELKKSSDVFVISPLLFRESPQVFSIVVVMSESRLQHTAEITNFAEQKSHSFYPVQCSEKTNHRRRKSPCAERKKRHAEKSILHHSHGQNARSATLINALFGSVVLALPYSSVCFSTTSSSSLTAIVGQPSSVNPNYR